MITVFTIFLENEEGMLDIWKGGGAEGIREAIKKPAEENSTEESPTENNFWFVTDSGYCHRCVTEETLPVTVAPMPEVCNT